MLAVLFLSHLLAIMIATEQIHVIFLAFSKNYIPCLRQRSKNHTRPVAHPRIGHVPPPPPATSVATNWQFDYRAANPCYPSSILSAAPL